MFDPYDKKRWTKRAFIPEPDITTYELAEIISSWEITGGGPPRAGIDFRDDVWSELPDNIKRHFKELG
jgi:hypothetical protein